MRVFQRGDTVFEIDLDNPYPMDTLWNSLEHLMTHKIANWRLINIFPIKTLAIC